MADFYQYRLKAGQPIQAAVQGKMILVDDIDGAAGVDITPMLNNSTGRTMPGRKKAFKCWVDYDAVILQAAADCVVSIWLARNDVSLGFADGAQVNVAGSVLIENAGDQRVPVDIAGGAINVTAQNVGINNNLKTLVDQAPVGVGVATTPVISDVNMKRLRFRNGDATAKIGLGGAGVTLANAVIVLNPGDVWVEDDAPGAAWCAVSDKAGALLRVAGIKA